MLRPIVVYEDESWCMRTNRGVWGAESAIHLLLRLKPHSVHSLPWNARHVVALICMASMVQLKMM